jgi:prolyl oligopeptidase
VFRGTREDGGYGVSPAVLHDGQGRSLAFIERPLDTFHSEKYVLSERGAQRLAVPAKSEIVELVDGRVILRIEEAWEIGGKTFEPGSLLASELAATKASPDALKPAIIWSPGPREALHGVSATRDKLLVGVLDNVQGRTFIYTPSADGWTREPLALPQNVSVNFASADTRSNPALLDVSAFLTPTGLWLADCDNGAF